MPSLKPEHNNSAQPDALTRATDIERYASEGHS